MATLAPGVVNRSAPQPDSIGTGGLTSGELPSGYEAANPYASLEGKAFEAKNGFHKSYTEQAKPYQQAAAAAEAQLATTNAEIARVQQELDSADPFLFKGNTVEDAARRATAFQRTQELQGYIARKQQEAAAFTQQRDEATAQVQTALKQRDASIEKVDHAVNQIKYADTTNRKSAEDNSKAQAAYQQTLAQYGDKKKAYDAYLKQKAGTAAHNAALQEDIRAGKYNVDPYDFIQQGATLPERMELLSQLNKGVAKPTMRAPKALVDPTAIGNPGDAPAPIQIKNDVAAQGDAGVLEQLGYKPSPTATGGTREYTPSNIVTQPSGPTKESPANGGQFSVGGLKAPTPAPATTPTPAPATTPAPAQSPGATLGNAQGSTQTTSTEAAKTNTTQQTTAAQTTQAPAPQTALNASASIAPQTTGSVSGQTSNAQGQSAPQATPEQITKPTPFKDEPAEEKDDVWEL